MGTLYDQRPRETCQVELVHLTKTLQQLAEETGCTLTEAIAIAHVAELVRRNDLYVRNGDAWDEQIGGIGAEIAGISHELDALSRALNLIAEVIQ